MLEDYNRDLHSIRYICPVDFKREHDRYVERRRKERKRQRILDLREKLKAQERIYAKAKKTFLALRFSGDNITIKFMDTVQEIADIGDELRHCIYHSNYHLKKSLLFCAYIGDAPMETIEVSHKDFEVIQSRGFENLPSKYHNKIVKLMNKNKYVIKKAASGVKKKLKKKSKVAV